jgi:hypothetical protein
MRKFRFSAKSKKVLESQFKAIKLEDKLVTMADLYKAEDAALEQFGYDSQEYEIAKRLTVLCSEYMNKYQKEYDKLGNDIEAVAKRHQASLPQYEYVYLWDESVDHENVTESSEITESHVVYWARMCSAGCMAAGERANEYGIDLNSALGYIVF